MNNFTDIYNLLKNLEKDYLELDDNYKQIDNKYNYKLAQYNELLKINDAVNNENEVLKKKVETLIDEVASLKKISIYASLNKQLLEKDNYIKVLERRLELSNNKTISSPSPSLYSPNTPISKDNEHNLENEDDDDDEPEIEYDTVKIGKKYYYVSNEDPSYVYEVIKGSNDVGNKLGKYNKDLNKIENE
jgi:hypothetical protein